MKRSSHFEWLAENCLLENHPWRFSLIFPFFQFLRCETSQKSKIHQFQDSRIFASVCGFLVKQEDLKVDFWKKKVFFFSGQFFGTVAQSENASSAVPYEQRKSSSLISYYCLIHHFSSSFKSAILMAGLVPVFEYKGLFFSRPFRHVVK